MPAPKDCILGAGFLCYIIARLKVDRLKAEGGKGLVLTAFSLQPKFLF